MGRYGRNLSDDEHARRLALYEDGLLDREIAAEVGVSASSIHAWRKARGLSPHHRSTP